MDQLSEWHQPAILCFVGDGRRLGWPGRLTILVSSSGWSCNNRHDTVKGWLCCCSETTYLLLSPTLGMMSQHLDIVVVCDITRPGIDWSFKEIENRSSSSFTVRLYAKLRDRLWVEINANQFDVQCLGEDHHLKMFLGPTIRRKIHERLYQTTAFTTEIHGWLTQHSNTTIRVLQGL